VRVIVTPSLDLGAAACSRTPDDGDVSAVETDDLVDELGDDADGPQDSGSDGIGDSGDTVAATFGRLHKSLLGLVNHVFWRPKRLREPTVAQKLPRRVADGYRDLVNG
jgi:hypothetical protein